MSLGFEAVPGLWTFQLTIEWDTKCGVILDPSTKHHSSIPLPLSCSSQLYRYALFLRVEISACLLLYLPSVRNLDQAGSTTVSRSKASATARLLSADYFVSVSERCQPKNNLIFLLCLKIAIAFAVTSSVPDNLALQDQHNAFHDNHPLEHSLLATSDSNTSHRCIYEPSHHGEVFRLSISNQAEAGLPIVLSLDMEFKARGHSTNISSIFRANWRLYYGLDILIEYHRRSTYDQHSTVRLTWGAFTQGAENAQFEVYKDSVSGHIDHRKFTGTFNTTHNNSTLHFNDGEPEPVLIDTFYAKAKSPYL
jgi:hypothetical protein